jgi:recombination protein RecT
MANEVVLASATNVQQALAKNMTALKSLLPAAIAPEKMARLAMNQLRINPALTKCKIESFMGAVMQSSALGLEIDSRQLAYLIPYGDEVSFQPGYRGLMQLFYNSSLAKSIIAEEVRENDVFEFDLTSGNKPVHKYDLKQDRGEVIAYYCIAELTTGAFTFKIMTKKEIDKHKDKFSKAGGKAGGKSPWTNNYDSMAMKTVIIKTLKYMPKSTEMERLESAMYSDSKTVKGYEFNEVTKQLDVNSEFIDNDEAEEIKKEVSAEAKAKLANAMKTPIETADYSEIKIETPDFVDILKTELREKNGLELDKLATANNLTIDQELAKSLLDNPALLKKYIGKAI